VGATLPAFFYLSFFELSNAIHDLLGSISSLPHAQLRSAIPHTAPLTHRRESFKTLRSPVIFSRFSVSSLSCITSAARTFCLLPLLLFPPFGGQACPMAYRVAGGAGNRPPLLEHAFDHQPTSRHVVGKRRVIYFEEDIVASVEDEVDEYPLPRPYKRRRESFTLDTVHFYSESSIPLQQPAPERLPEFLVLNESSVPPRLTPNPVAGVGMERTASGMSISDDMTDGCALTELLEDAAAAQRVREHMATFRRRFPDSKHERVLRSIISPKSPAAAYPLDNDALESIFFAANEIFFNGRLSQRVTWDWSHSSSPQYDSSVIGTTALRRASKRGFETLIVLSSPILQDRKYSRRLLISTFLHELIHSYMFICCGFRARHCGGHTPGFHTIAGLIDDWAGPDSFLHLRKMEADLSCFRADHGPEHDLDLEQYGYGSATPLSRERTPFDQGQKENIYPCSGIMDRQQDYHPSNGQHRHASPEQEHHYVQNYQDYHNDDHNRQWRDHRANRPAQHHHQPYDHSYDRAYGENDDLPRYGSPYV
jgi:hypothetical protein